MDAFRTKGAGWQSKINAVLRKSVGRSPITNISPNPSPLPPACARD
ncbi:BrnA antitoxin family protein [Methylovirgula sp. 4M-Z18]